MVHVHVDQVASQKGRHEVVAVPEVEAAVDANVVLDTAVHVHARRGAAHESDRIGARRDVHYHV